MPSDLAQGHDLLFKLLLEQPGVAGALLRERLSPALVARMRAGEPELMPAEFASVKLRRSQADRLFRIRLLGGEAAYVYCLIEHKSAPDPDVGLQLLGYLAELLRRLSEKPEHSGKLPLVVPLVVYHGAARWKGPWRFSDEVECEEELCAEGLDFPIRVLDVGHVPAPELSALPHLRGGLLLLRYSVRYPKYEPVETLARMLEDLRGMSDSFLEAVGRYMYFQFEEARREELRAAVLKAMPEKEEQMVSRAVQETLAEGEARVILRQIERRFGPVSEELRERLGGASLEELEVWSERVLDAKRLEDIFDGAGG